MKFHVLRDEFEADSFEEACERTGHPQPEFEAGTPPGVFHINGTFWYLLEAPEEEDDDELTAAVNDFVDLFDGQLVLDDDTGEPQLELSDFDDSDELTDAEAEEITQASLELGEMFLAEMTADHGTT